MAATVSIAGRPGNFDLRLLPKGWITIKNAVFVITTKHGRRRIVVPAGARIRSPQPHRVRAGVLRDALLRNRNLNITPYYSAKTVDDIYIQAAKEDGARWLTTTRLWLYVIGLARRGLLYWV